MFKLSKLLRALLWAGISRITMDEGGGGAGAPGMESHIEQGGEGGEGGGQSNPWDNAPKSWSQEHIPHWSRVDPEVRKIIHERESHVDRGFQTYRQSHENWGRLSKHFEPWTSKNPNLNVAELYESLAQNHIQLMRAEPEQRAEMFKELAGYYGVELTQRQAERMAEGQGQGQGFDQKTLEKMLQPLLQKTLGPIAQRFQSMEEERAAAQAAESKKTVDAFFSDSKNKYVDKVATMMGQLIQSGEARSLDRAYELACLGTPAVRQLYLADLAAGGQESSEEGSNVRNLKSNGTGAPPGKPKTMDETLNAVARKHFPDYKG
jgi:hypothetical protein